LNKDSVLVLATVVAKPGSEHDVHERFSKLVMESRTESGCVSYDLYVSNDDAATYVSVEQWTGPQALQEHMARPNVQSAIGGIGPLVAKPPTILTYRMITDPA
jgi:quinol monooxygenase YgiN